MNILSCNIRYYNAADGPNHWPFRKDLCVEVIRSRQPDIVCLQEAWREQLADLRPGLPEFEAVGMVDEPLGRNPVNTILYRRERFRAIAQGGFWLSEQPHVSGSRSWDSGSVRLANWLRLEDRVMKTEFRVVNTHLDDVSQLARENQARVICEDAAVYPEHYPQLLTGDMNADGLNRAIQMFKEEGWADTYEAIHGNAANSAIGDSVG